MKKSLIEKDFYSNKRHIIFLFSFETFLFLEKMNKTR